MERKIKNKIIKGDCIEKLKKLEENSVDVILTDPPYGIGFMGKEWDNFKPSTIEDGMAKDKRKKTQIASTRISNIAGTYDKSIRGARGFQKFCEAWSKEALRVLKPGGLMLVFCSTRMYHRMTCGVEDAGFEIRDTILWLYGSGFPKSLNIGKQVDKIRGNEREVIGKYQLPDVADGLRKKDWDCKAKSNESNFGASGQNELTKGNTEWEGWGTALKPSHELIVVARKPLSEKNVALNVLKWGTGGINIDDCRIGNKTVQGRFPANIILDEEAGRMLDEQTGTLKSGDNCTRTKEGNFLEHGGLGKAGDVQRTYGDKGGASRFFYCAKASKAERNFGCENLDEKPRTIKFKNNHPTVKPIKLMEYLIRLASREGAIILDPFLGSGTTAIACIKLNRKFIGIEKEEEYIKISKARIKPFLKKSKKKK